MQHRKLGKSGLEVSVIGLGGGMLGSSDNSYTLKVIKRAIDLGVNYFDTAHSYPDSEVKLGQALKERREEVYISQDRRDHQRRSMETHQRILRTPPNRLSRQLSPPQPQRLERP